jgi:hypothetical protein
MTGDASIPSEVPLRPSRTLRVARRTLWHQALRQRSVWLRAVKLGLTVGLLQATINQGDHWWHGEVNSTVLAKSFVSPLIGFTLVLFSAAQTWVHRTLEQNT